MPGGDIHGRWPLDYGDRGSATNVLRKASLPRSATNAISEARLPSSGCVRLFETLMAGNDSCRGQSARNNRIVSGIQPIVCKPVCRITLS